MFYVKEFRREEKKINFSSLNFCIYIWWYRHCFYQYDSIIYYIVSFNATHAKILRSIKNNKNTMAIHANTDVGNKRYEWQKLQIRRIATIYYLSYHFWHFSGWWIHAIYANHHTAQRLIKLSCGINIHLTAFYTLKLLRWKTGTKPECRRKGRRRRGSRKLRAYD